jgi:predicted Zn-dependent protease
MFETLRTRFHSLRSSAPFFALRYVEETREVLAVRQDTPEPPRLHVERGVMITAITEGGYGYCATSDVSPAGLQAALDRATAWAEATSAASVCRYSPADMPAPRSERRAASASAPSLSRSELYDLLADECREARVDGRIVERVAGLELRQVEQLYLTNNGGDVHQAFSYAVPYAHVTANHDTETQMRSFADARQGGLESIGRSALRLEPGTRSGHDFVGCGRRLADEALQLLGAPNCPSGTMDLLLMPDQMMLQIHESIGHPLELDRILGDERNYAGTSFVTREMFGQYRYGSPLLNVTFDPTIREELASYAFDDDGDAAEKAWLIRDGILQRPLGGRISQLRAELPGTANSRAGSWNRPAIDRMANLNVEPGSSTFAEMVESIENGVVMRTNTSWSIDDSRNKFQFGCEWGERIENGEIKGVVKNPNYRGVSAEFWRNLKKVGDAATFEVHGTLYCGKGEPNQVIHVGHASPVCLFSDVEVFGGEAA